MELQPQPTNQPQQQQAFISGIIILSVKEDPLHWNPGSQRPAAFLAGAKQPITNGIVQGITRLTDNQGSNDKRADICKTCEKHNSALVAEIILMT